MSSEGPRAPGPDETDPDRTGTPGHAPRTAPQDPLWTGPVPGLPAGAGDDLFATGDEPVRRRRRSPTPRASTGPAAAHQAAARPPAHPPAHPSAARPAGLPEPPQPPDDDATPWVEKPFDADDVLPEPAPPRAPDGVPIGELVDLTPPALVAREALNRAKAAARARGYRPGQEPRRRPLDPPRGSAGKDARDPQTVGDTLARLLRDRGWVQDVSVGGVIGRWREVVGDQIADHCEPETFQDGVLTVRTDSTAWATQVRLLVPRLLLRLADDVGEGVVREVRVVGPSGPGFGRGPRSVPGRGPRDTWG